MGSEISYILEKEKKGGRVLVSYNTYSICVRAADFPSCPWKHCLHVEELCHPTEDSCLAEWALLPPCALSGYLSLP